MSKMKKIFQLHVFLSMLSLPFSTSTPDKNTVPNQDDAWKDLEVYPIKKNRVFKAFEVSTKPLFLVGTKKDIVSQVEEELSKLLASRKNEQKLRTYSTSDTLFVFCLFGWSGGSLDEMRRIKITKACIKERDVHIHIDYPTFEYSEPMIEICNVVFVGRQIPLGKLLLGKYTVSFYSTYRHIRVDVSERPWESELVTERGDILERKIEFRVDKIPTSSKKNSRSGL